jgi:predicted phage tail protein
VKGSRFLFCSCRPRIASVAVISRRPLAAGAFAAGVLASGAGFAAGAFFAELAAFGADFAAGAFFAAGAEAFFLFELGINMKTGSLIAGAERRLT